ncbi:MAG: hypothetical protein ACYC0F_01885 [Rhodanobacter sp.]
MPAALSLATHRRAIRLPWLLIGGYTVATLDMLAAIAYWTAHGSSATRVLQSVATWFLGPAAYAGGATTAVLGMVVYAQLMWGVVALYHAIAQRHPVLLRRPLACGAVYGALAYAAIFQVMAPLLSGIHPAFEPVWVATCVVVYTTLVGMPCALFARAAAAAREKDLEAGLA